MRPKVNSFLINDSLVLHFNPILSIVFPKIKLMRRSFTLSEIDAHVDRIYYLLICTIKGVIHIGQLFSLLGSIPLSLNK